MFKSSFTYKTLILLFVSIFIISCDPTESNSNVSSPKTQTETESTATQTKEENQGTPITNSVKDSAEYSLPIIEIIVFTLILFSFLMVVIFILFDVKKTETFYTLKRKKPSLKDRKHEIEEKPLHSTNDPEIQKINSDIDGHIAHQSQTINELRRDLAGLIRNISDLNETFMTLKTSLDQKDEEISRYKNGYDAIIFKNFLLRFTRVDKVIKEYTAENKIDMNGLKDIQIQMDDALAECDVEIFSPKIGSNFKTSIGVADNPDIKETSNQSEDSTIAEVLKPGYRRKLPNASSEEYQIITEAKVVIYVYKKNKK